MEASGEQISFEFDYYLFYSQVEMESRSYMFSTAKKRSTLLENKGIEYLRSYAGSHETTNPRRACLS